MKTELSIADGIYKDFNFASFYWINMNMKEHIKLPEIWCIMTMVEIFV